MPSVKSPPMNNGAAGVRPPVVSAVSNAPALIVTKPVPRPALFPTTTPEPAGMTTPPANVFAPLNCNSPPPLTARPPFWMTALMFSVAPLLTLKALRFFPLN